MSPTKSRERPFGLAVFLVIAGLIGLTAAFVLTLDKFALLEDPDAQLSCNFSVLVGCSTNLSAWQGSVFGFPNPLIGVAAWSVVITIGMAILANARFSRWFWIGLNLGMTAAVTFVIWLIYQSIFLLDVLCPWCMVTWAVTIPGFLAVTFYNVKSRHIPSTASVRRFAGGAYSWLLLITLACYLVVAVIAQLQMDVLSRI
ncbi:vitamin K epoxide reductase family protein [Glaciibacter superstes]|uniref:vitamin K epoxide reductase family protein n=1 Tax=Glaciibacter superstes TaxID=501023 RepID=UPI0003B50101|nr:vitamin K epoxide reductase family protein [Glaciibacter superstes]